MTDRPLRKQREYQIVKSLVEAAREYLALTDAAEKRGVPTVLLDAANKRLKLATKKAVRMWEITQ